MPKTLPEERIVQILEKVKSEDDLLNSAVIYLERETQTIKMIGLRPSDGSLTGEYTLYTEKNVGKNGFVDATGNVFLVPDIGWKTVTLGGTYSVYSCDANGKIVESWSRTGVDGISALYKAERKSLVSGGYIAVYNTNTTSMRYFGFATTDAVVVCPKGRVETTASYAETFVFDNGRLMNGYAIPEFSSGSVLANGNGSTTGAGKTVAARIKAGTRLSTKNTALSCSIFGCDAHDMIYVTTSNFDSLGKEYVFKNDSVVAINFTVGSWTDTSAEPDIPALNCQYFLRFIDDEQNKWKGKSWYSYGTSISDVGVGDTDGNNGHVGKWPLCVDVYSQMNRTNGAWGSNGIMTDSNLWNGIMSTPWDVDIVTLELGPNDDYWTTLGEVGDTGDDTFMGRLYQIYDYLTKNTRAQVVFVAVGARQFTMNTTDIVPANGHWRSRYRILVNAVKELSNLFGIPVIDADANACNLNHRAKDIVMKDYIHYTYLGGEMYGRYIWDQIKQLEPYPIFVQPST